LFVHACEHLRLVFHLTSFITQLIYLKMKALDKILLNEISHKLAYHFYEAYRFNFNTDLLDDDDMDKFREYGLIFRQMVSNGTEIIKSTRLGDMLFKRIAEFMDTKKFGTCHERIFFYEPFFT